LASHPCPYLTNRKENNMSTKDKQKKTKEKEERKKMEERNPYHTMLEFQNDKE